MSMLEIKDLSVTFGGLHALKNLDFRVEEGEIVSVIGPNGAGKSSLFRALTGQNRIYPRVLHFSGHGTRNGLLVEITFVRETVLRELGDDPVEVA